MTANAKAKLSLTSSAVNNKTNPVNPSHAPKTTTNDITIIRQREIIDNFTLLSSIMTVSKFCHFPSYSVRLASCCCIFEDKSFFHDDYSYPTFAPQQSFSKKREHYSTTKNTQVWTFSLFVFDLAKGSFRNIKQLFGFKLGVLPTWIEERTKLFE